VPVEVENITTAVQVDRENEHACAVLSSGHAECWGSNFKGELGDGRGPKKKGTREPTPTPAEVVDVTDFTQVALEAESSCGLAATGHVYCWGVGGQGQLGIGKAEMKGITSPTEVPVI